MLRSKPAWMILSALSAALAGFVTRAAVQKAWTAATGDEMPPADDDRSVATARAIAWPPGWGQPPESLGFSPPGGGEGLGEGDGRGAPGEDREARVLRLLVGGGVADERSRSPSGWVGRKLPSTTAVKASSCSCEISTGVSRTCQATPSVHGGVVSDPSYWK